MNDQNSTPNNIVRPSDLMAELDIKKSTYYGDLEYLDIKADKDESGKSYLTFEQANQIRGLRSHVNQTGRRDGFESVALVVSNNNELSTKSEPTNIYVEAEEPTSNMDINALMRHAAELKARELATPDLVVRELANRMSESDLPEDLQEKVAIAREVANPKWTPADVAENLLSQYRSQSVS